MIVIINNCSKKEKDYHDNLKDVVELMERSHIHHRVCKQLEEVEAIEHRGEHIHGFILSGSYHRLFNSIDHEYVNFTLHVIKRYYQRIPIFALCFACQAIHLHFGGQLENYDQLRCIHDLDITLLAREPLFHHPPPPPTSLKPNHEHFPIQAKICFNELPIPTEQSQQAFHPIAWERYHTNHPLAYKHNDYPLYISMFHPENNESTHWIYFNFVYRICGMPEYNPSSNQVRGGGQRRRKRRQTRKRTPFGKSVGRKTT